MKEVVFWQRMFSPHMLGLAEALAERGIRVTFVATEHLSRDRREQGWQVPPKGAVRRLIIDNPIDAKNFIAGLPQKTQHITQGLRGNGVIGIYQKLINSAGHRHWVIMETVDLGGWRAAFKKAVYAYVVWQKGEFIDGVLAIGDGTDKWLMEAGLKSEKVFPFAYFIDAPLYRGSNISVSDKRPFTFAFVGNLEPWKNPTLALDAYIELTTGKRRLIFAGGGSLSLKLEARALTAPIDAEIDFRGRLPMAKIPELLAEVDCLLLPSNVDGWGVVASEAMLMGIPVIVSDVCGVRAAVRAAPQGLIFPARDIEALKLAMQHMQLAGRDISRRAALSIWAQHLSSTFGAEYLEQILSGRVWSPLPTWLARSRHLQ